MNSKLKEIEKQLSFCSTLMKHLVIDFKRNTNEEPYYSWLLLANKTRMQNDIKRLRRELMDLYKQLERNGG